MKQPFELQINTLNGHSLRCTCFLPEQSNFKSIVISSATGVLQYYYHKIAIHFSGLGYIVYTFDYYGIGKSENSIKKLKQNPYDLKDWGENDQAAVIDHVKTKYPSHKIILITHSIGGQILAFNKSIYKIDAIITIASQSGYWKLWKGYERLRMFTFWYILIPFLTPLFGYFPAKKIGLFENLPRKMVYQWSRWGKQKDYFLSEFELKNLELKNYNKKLLSLSFPKDEYATKTSVDWLANLFTNATIDRRHINPEEMGIKNVGHFGYFKTDFKESLWNLTHHWIKNNT